jgi:hypothetical protein
MTQKKISKNDYAVFILTHGRPEKVITYDTLINCGYTGQIYIIIDNEDKFKNEYYKKFGSKVIEFSKSDYEGKFDIMDNFNNNKVIVYARNACYDIARKLNLKFFFEYEDDYTSFLYRYIKNDQLKGITVRDLDKVLELMINCLINTKSDTIAFAQGGDFIGGAGAFKSNSFKRKAMNSFLFKVNEDPKNDIIFIGRMNDDVNTYLSKGKIGKLFFQISNINLNQLQTQSNSGGNTEIYQQFGTYSKSFYSVMIEPSCVKINLMGNIHKRLHHTIKWENAVPKILSEEVKK